MDKNTEKILQENLFPKLDTKLRTQFQNLLKTIDDTFPLSAKHRSGLPRDIAELSRQLTSGRSDRADGYLGKAAPLSAYLRYFLPWNVFRLLRLLPALTIELSDGNTVCDLGSGPMTFALALWIARPDLRKLNLEIRCVDRTAPVLEAGKKLFYAFAGTSALWKIKTIKGSLGTEIYGEQSALVTAINVYNEIFWDDKNNLQKIVKNESAYLMSLVKKNGSVLVVEPGIPRSGEFISRLRAQILTAGNVSAPCPHWEKCPFPGGKRGTKWCHFSFDTSDAPSRLHALSKASGLPKERAVLSFIFFKADYAQGVHPLPKTIHPVASDGLIDSQPSVSSEKTLHARIISDAIVLGERHALCGRYACSSQGMILVTGEKQTIENISSGTLIELEKNLSKRKDPKTGVMMFEIDRLISE